MNPFLLSALLASFLASISSGIMGSFIVIKKISSIAGSIAHSILGGIGFFLFLNYKYNLTFLKPIYGAFLAALISAFLIGLTHLKYKQKEDAVIAAIWSTGMAIGIIFISLINNYNVDFSTYLFGNILLAEKSDIYMLLTFDIIIAIATFLFYQKFLVICFDEDLSFLKKLPTKSLYFFLLALIAISIVLLIQIIGIILVIALLIIPPTIASNFVEKLSHVIYLSIILCCFFNFSGIMFSYGFNFPPGATIAITAGIFYFLQLFINKRKAI